MTPLSTPTIQDLKEFYSVSASMPTHKIEEFTNVVRNLLFVKMFGFEAANKILSGEILESSSSVFIGFQKFFALCVVYQTIKDPLIHTNFGLKSINRVGVSDPTSAQKSTDLIDVESTISAHYREALKVVNTAKCGNVPVWGGSNSYKISKL